MSLCVQELSFAYGAHSVLHQISFQVEPGEFLSVLGPNGVGKSTLFRCMLGLLKPTTGGVWLDGVEVSTMSPQTLSQGVAYIPQSQSMVFNYTVLDTVLMGTTAQVGAFSSPGSEQRQRAEGALSRMGIDHLKDRGFRNLSGGEQQLVLLARAIAQQARVLVMDEPAANLDFGNRIQVMQTIQDLTQEGYTVIQSTHDPEQAYRYSSRILALKGGRVAAWGNPEETVTEELISSLYGVQVAGHRLLGDQVRIFFPTRWEEEKKECIH